MSDDSDLHQRLERLEEKLDTLLTLVVKLVDQPGGGHRPTVISPPPATAKRGEDAPTAVNPAPAATAVPEPPQPEARSTPPLAHPPMPPPSTEAGMGAFVLLVTGPEECTYWLKEGRNRIGSGSTDPIRITHESAVTAGHVDLILKEGALKLIARSPGVMFGPPPSLPLRPGSHSLLTAGDCFVIGGTKFVIDRGGSLDE